MIGSIARAYKTSFTGLSRNTWLLSAIILINRSTYMAVPFMSLYVTRSLHRQMSDAGIVLTLFGAGSILGVMAGGKLTDIFGHRIVQIVSIMTGGLLFIGFAFLTHFASICALTLFIGFFTEGFRPANFAAIASYARPGTATRSYSLNRLATNVGWATGTSLGGLLASIKYELLFIVDGGASVVAGILILLLLPRSRQTHEKHEASAGPVSRKPWQDGIFVRFILNTLLFTTCFFLMFRVIPLFFREVWRLNERTIGLIIGLNGILVALFEMVLVTRIENRRRPVFYITLGTILLALSYCILLLPPWAPVLAGALTITLFSFGEMLSIPFINAYVISRSDESNRGLYAAGYTLTWSFAQLAGPTSGFYFAQAFGYRALWIVLMAVLLLAALGYRLIGRNQVDAGAAH